MIEQTDGGLPIEEDAVVLAGYEPPLPLLEQLEVQFIQCPAGQRRQLKQAETGGLGMRLERILDRKAHREQCAATEIADRLEQCD
ncbi:MAG: hypothetical protein M3O62_05000, partial [Pseudomonadota bacterium]|nr:hypothetical protein [Pseudomonadota bacterium]